MKHKDHYDDAYIAELSRKIQAVNQKFEAQKFRTMLQGNLEDKELFARLDYIVDAMVETMGITIQTFKAFLSAWRGAVKSVGNNLNDLFKQSPQKAQELIAQWRKSPTSKTCEWIIKHGERNQNKKS